MNAVEILEEHLRMLLTVYGPDARGAGYLLGLIDARNATGDLDITLGYTSFMQPNTLDGYLYGASKIFGEDSVAVGYLQELMLYYAPNHVILLPEVEAAYQLGLLVAGLNMTTPILPEVVNAP